MEQQLRINNLQHNKSLGVVLKENGVSINEFEHYWEIANKKLVGSGSNGNVFDIGNNQVLKITKDEKEYLAIKKCIELIDNNDWIPNTVLLPKVICPVNENFSVFATNKVNYRYYFIFDKLNELSNDDDYMFKLVLQYFECSGFDEIEEFDESTIEEIINFIEKYFSHKYKQYGHEYIMGVLYFIKNIVEFSNKFEMSDLHIGNILVDDDGNYKLIDYRTYE